MPDSSTLVPGSEAADQYLSELHPDRWTQPFWDACREHRLVVAECDACGAFRMPPVPFCHVCRKQEIYWREVSGRGTVYAFTVVRQGVVPELAAAVPYVVAVVELDGAPGIRLVAGLRGTTEVSIGDPVEVEWYDSPEGTTIPRFRRLADAPALAAEAS